MTHTPGPWRIQEGDSVVNVMAGPLAITATCTKPYYEKFDAEDLANARLIAAAPDLLEVLKDALALADRNVTPAGRTEECQALYDRCQQIIAKATGAK